MHLITRQTCRICGSGALKEVVNLGEQYLQGSFVRPEGDSPPLRKVPCVLVRCDPEQDETACGLLQLKHSVPPAILYSSYWYRSGTNETMRRHLAGVAEKAMAMLGKTSNVQRPTSNIECRVLDIGCNDGTLLKAYPKEWEKIGCDPSDIAEEIELDGPCSIYKATFPTPYLTPVDDDHQFADLAEESRFDLITSIAMFYDLEEPVRFVKAIAACLKENGIWIAEMSYMPSMLATNSFDTICHEHLEYYSLGVIENLLARARLKVVRAELNAINGGSIRCFVKHQNAECRMPNVEWEEGLKKLRHAEFELELDTDRPYRDFQANIRENAQKLHKLLSGLKAEGKRVHIYGASTKGNTILQYASIDRTMVDCAADRNPEKHGAKTLGTGIPIISEAGSRAMKPDYYLVLPWHFREEFMEREKAAFEAGVGFIFPLPKLNIVQNTTNSDQ